MTAPNREGILLAAPTRWDDACFLVPVARAVTAAGVRVGVLCPQAQEQLWASVGGCEVVVFGERESVRKLGRGLRGEWSAAVLLEPGTAAESCRQAKIPRRLGPELKPLKNFLTHPVPVPAPNGAPRHRVADFLGLVEALGMPHLDPAFFAPVDLGVPVQPGSILIVPDSDYGPAYEWPLQRWVDLTECLLAQGHSVTIADLVGTSGMGETLVAALGGEIPWVEIDALADALPLLAVHELVVAMDGSLPHLAAHAGCRCVTVFGPGDPVWRRPLGKRHTVLSVPVECSPCLLEKCPIDHRCLRELDDASMLAAVLAQLQRNAAAASESV